MFKLDDKKIVNAWAMYDWANSVYNLIITTTFFPVYYIASTSSYYKNGLVNFLGYNFINSVLYNYAVSFSYLIVVLIIPTLSALADYYKNKLIYLKIFSTIGAISCFCLFFFTGQNVEFGIFCFILATIGFTGSLVFYNSYLPEIASLENQDKVSARGYILGYIGSVIVQLIGFAILIIKPFQITEGMAIRITFLIVGLWWFGFAQYSFNILKQVYIKPIIHKENLIDIIKNSYLVLIKVGKKILVNKEIKLFLIAFFFYNMGVQTVMIVAINFGQKVLNIPGTKLIITAVFIQIVAIFGAYLTALIAKIKGNIFTIISIVFLWILVCFAAYFITKDYHFYILAMLVGLVMGAIQSMSRSTFSKLMPKIEDTTSYFSFYDIVEKFTIIFGVFIFGFIESITNNMRYSVLSLILFFILSIPFLFSIKLKKV